jgi:glycosyltransferase involved in cell wall biosynthesis
MVKTIQNGLSGFVDTDTRTLIARMQELLRNPGYAKYLGDHARKFAEEHFGIERFKSDWDIVLNSVTTN